MATNRMSQGGFCLIELMLSIYLAGFALLSLSALVYQSLVVSYSTSLYATAEQQAFAATELLRANGSWQSWQQELFLPDAVSDYMPGQAINISWYDKHHQQFARISLPCARL